MNRTVLHVGCGSSTIAAMPRGFQDGSWRELRFDIDPTYSPDFIGTMLDMQAVASDSVDALYSSHNIEHVYAHEVQIVLREFQRVLKPDGFAVVTCPDIQTVAEHVAQGRMSEPLYRSPSGPVSALDIMYGHGAAIERGEIYMAHKTAFTIQTLVEAMRAAGFGTVGGIRRPNRYDLWVLATPIKIEKKQLQDMMDEFTC